MVKLKVALLSACIGFVLVLSVCAVILTSQAVDGFSQIAKSIESVNENQQTARYNELKAAIADFGEELEDVKAEIRDLCDNSDESMRALGSLSDRLEHISNMLERIMGRAGGNREVNPKERERDNIRRKIIDISFGVTNYIFKEFMESAARKKNNDGEYWEDAEPILEKYRELVEEKGLHFTYRYFSSPDNDKFTLVFVPQIAWREKLPEDFEVPRLAFLLTSTGEKFICKESPVEEANEFTIADWEEEIVLPHEGEWHRQ